MTRTPSPAGPSRRAAPSTRPVLHKACARDVPGRAAAGALSNKTGAAIAARTHGCCVAALNETKGSSTQMQFHIRTVMRAAVSGGLAALALSGIATTAAQAASVFEKTNIACSGGNKFDLCYEGTNPKGESGKWQLKGEQAVEVTSLTPIVFKQGTAITIECTKVKQGTTGAAAVQANPSTENGKAVWTLVYEGCAITAPKAIAENCTIPSRKETGELSGEYTSEADLRLMAKAGETAAFLVIVFSDKELHTCALKGTKEITGFQDVEILKPGTAEKTKKVKFKEASGLKFRGEAMSLTGELEEKFPGLGAEVYVSKVA
jgi:hypothetical protein